MTSVTVSLHASGSRVTWVHDSIVMGLPHTSIPTLAVLGGTPTRVGSLVVSNFLGLECVATELM